MEDDGATELWDQVHARHFQTIFSVLGVDREESIVCRTSDNCTTNLKIAELLGIPHIGCNRH